MAGPDLPPAVQRFIANMDDYDGPIEQAMALVDAFAERNDEAAAQARAALAEAADAADRARDAYEVLLAAVRQFEGGVGDLDRVLAAYRETQDLVNDSIEKSAFALEAAQRAADGYRDALDGLKAAEDLAAGASGDLRDKLGMTGLTAEGAASRLNDLRDAAYRAAAAENAMGNAALIAGAKAAAGAEMADAAGGGGGGAVTRRGVGGGGFGFLFGGTIGGIAAWHVALDAVLEAVISIGLATVAAAAGFAAMAESAYNIYTHLSAVQTVVSAMGQYISPLTGAFDRIVKAMAPQTLEAYGGLLHMLSQNAGAFGDVAKQVVTLIDDWVAKMDIWARTNGNFASLLHAGVGYLTQFGQIIGTVGQAIGNLLREDPGIAHFLLDVLQGFATLLKLFTELPHPIVEVALAVHGLWLWMKVLTAPILNAGRALHIFSDEGVKAFDKATSFHNLMRLAITNPWAWVAIAAGSVAYFTYRANQGSPAAQKFINAINEKIDAASASQAINDITIAIGQLNDKIRSTSTGSELNQMFSGGFGSQFGKMFTQDIPDWIMGVGHAFMHLSDEVAHGGLTGALGALGGLFKAAFTNAGAGAEAAGIDVSRFNDEIDKLLGQQRNLFHETGVLMTGTQGLGASQQAAAMQAKRQGAEINTTAHSGLSYAQALAVMDLAGVKAGDSFAVMNQKVINLEQGYKNAGVQGGMLGNAVNAVTFSALQQQSKVTQLTQAWSQFFSTLTGGESGFTQFASDIQGNVPVKPVDNLNQAIKSVHGNFSLLTAAGLQARDEFLSTAQAAQTEQNNLTLLSSAAGEGAKGNQMLAQASKDMIAQMLPAAKDSKGLTTVLYGLAQQGGYQGADSFKALSTWVGNTKDPMQNLDGIVQTLTEHAGNLAGDVKNLSVALGQTLTTAEKQAIFYADGGQQAFDNYATSLKNNGIQSNITKTAATQLAEELIRVTGNTKNAHAEFDTMTIGMGYTKAQADRLWNSLNKVRNSENALHNKYFTITGKGTGVFSISTNAGTEALMHHAPSGPGINPKLHTVAAGGIMRGGTPGRDSIHALLMPGEGVLTTKAVSMLGEHTVHSLNRMAETGAAHALHRMAAGGIAGGGDAGGSINRLAGMPGKFQDHMTADMIQSMERAMTAAERAAAAAAAAAAASGGGMLHPTGSGGSVAALMRSMAASVGWTGSLWTDLYNVEMREAGFQLGARNPSSGAYGLAQFINGPGEYAQYGGNAGTAAGQITAMINYIRQRYGTPAGAWAHELQYGWYEKGGYLPPGLSLAANGTGRPERVLGPNEEIVVPVTVMLDGKVLFESVQRTGRRYAKRNSLSGPSSGAKAFAVG